MVLTHVDLIEKLLHYNRECSRTNHPDVQPNISPLASDGAGKGKSELLSPPSLLHPSDGRFFLLPYKFCGSAVISPAIRHSIFVEPDFRISHLWSCLLIR